MNLNEKSYNTILSETNDFFQAQGVSIIGEGYKEIATNPTLFESYVENLTEGASADHAAQMAQLMANSNTSLLMESSITGIQPIASLSNPVIRKLWPKFVLKEALNQEVAKSPRFVIAYTKPYLFRGDANNKEERKYLPIRNDYTGTPGADDAEFGVHKEFTNEATVILVNGAAKVQDWAAECKVEGTSSAIKYQPLDELVIVECELGTSTDSGATFTELGTKKYAKIGKRLGVNGMQVYDLGGEYGQLVVRFDGANHSATFALVGATAANGAIQLKVKAGISSEYNERTWSVGYDIARQDIDIPTGLHINAPLPIEALNDAMALYQIDGTKETVDLMTNVFAMQLDLDVLDFIRDTFANQPTNEAFADYGTAEGFLYEFDCKPAAGFAGGPKAWREELKPLIDHLAQKIKNSTYLQNGVFNIVANPLDAQILANVDWSFRGGQGGNVDGVAVDYSIGTYVGANAYKVFASTNVPAGAMYLLFIPAGGKQRTMDYFAYSFSTELGYTDPNRSRTPSIMMQKRHTFHAFMPAVGAIVVKNNYVDFGKNETPYNQWVSTKAHQ